MQYIHDVACQELEWYWYVWISKSDIENNVPFFLDTVYNAPVVLSLIQQPTQKFITFKMERPAYW